MEKNYSYKNLIERQVKVVEAEGEGLRMISDTFDSDWNKGDEPHGTMVFTDVHPPTEIIPPPRDLFAEIDAIEVRLTNLEKGN